MIQPSASKAYIFANCSYAFDPAHEELSGSPGTAASRYGSAFHDVIASLIEMSLKTGTKPKTFAELVDNACVTWKIPPAAKIELAGHVWGSFLYLRNWMRGDNQWAIDWTAKNAGTLIVEKSYAVDVSQYGERDVVVREIDPPTVEDHTYENLKPFEIPMTADVMVIDGDVPPLVLDHKTGSSKDFSEPELDEQMLTMGLATTPRIDQDVVLAVHHADRRGLPMLYALDVPQTTLIAHEKRLARAFDRIGDGSMRPGPWCTYCPAKSICPTQYSKIAPTAMAIVESVGLSITRPEGDFEITPQFMGKMHFLRSQINAVMKRVDAEIHQYVEDNPSEVITRPDGKSLEWVTREYENISKKAFVDVLGVIEAEKWFVKLRKLGVLAKNSRRELHAVKEQGE